MGKLGKRGRERLDKYYKLAKDQGYRSRAAFKLIQLNKKFDFLSKARAVLDLCAAPGGWLQVAAKHMAPGSVIVGVDLVPIKPIPNTVTLVEDITTQKCRTSLKRELRGAQVDCVLHDGAPNMGTAWLQDAFTQSELVVHSLALATQFLRAGGTFVSKVFRSTDYNSLLFVLKQLFGRVEATKPASSRNQSAEIFVVCLNYLAPKKIDPRLLDPRFVFKELDGVQTDGPLVNIFHKKFGKKRNREGYETDGVTSLLRKRHTVRAFVHSDQPLTILAEAHVLEWEEKPSASAQPKGKGDGDGEGEEEEGEEAALSEEARFRNSKHTTPEVLASLEDLKVLSKGDFKNLLKWRMEMRKLRDSRGGKGDGEGDEGSEGSEEGEDEGGEGREELPDDPDARLSHELEELRKKQAAEKKRKKRKENAAKTKQRMRLELHMDLKKGEAPLEAESDHSLFSLAKVRSKGALDKLLNESSAIGDVLNVEQDDKHDKGMGSDSESDSDQEYVEILAKQMDTLWEQYKERKGQIEKRRRGRKGAGERGEGDNEEQDDDHDSVAGSDDEEGAGLVVRAPNAMEGKAQMWFSQPQFEALHNDDEDEDDSAEIMRLAEEFRKKHAGKHDDQQGKEEKQGKEGKEGKEGKQRNKRTREEAGLPMDEGEGEGGDDVGDEDWGLQEGEVFNEDVEGNSSSDESDKVENQRTRSAREEKVHEKAETLAIAKKLLNRELRHEIVDGAYNKLAFNDPELPEWFVLDEKKHRKPNLPVTKEEVSEMKRRFQEINARTIKKVAEAKARKKKRLVRAMARTKVQAEGILNNNEIPDKDKMREIDKLYKSRSTKTKISKTYVVANAGGRKTVLDGAKGRGVETRTRFVDKRLKADKRAKKARDRKGGKGRR